MRDKFAQHGLHATLAWVGQERMDWKKRDALIRAVLTDFNGLDPGNTRPDDSRAEKAEKALKDALSTIENLKIAAAAQEAEAKRKSEEEAKPKEDEKETKRKVSLSSAPVPPPPSLSLKAPCV